MRQRGAPIAMLRLDRRRTVTNHRKDLIWKPFGRMFRRWLKQDSLTTSIFEEIRSLPIHEQGLRFCIAIGVSPAVGQQVRNQVALLIMISSHRITWRRRLIPTAQQFIEPFQAELWPIFYRFFMYTSLQLRLQFFREPLIRELWPMFLVAKKDEITTFLRQMQAEHSSQIYLIWLQEVYATQQRTGCRILL